MSHTIRFTRPWGIVLGGILVSAGLHVSAAGATEPISAERALLNPSKPVAGVAGNSAARVVDAQEALLGRPAGGGWQGVNRSEPTVISLAGAPVNRARALLNGPDGQTGDEAR